MSAGSVGRVGDGGERASSAPRILLVEDNDDNRDMLSRRLMRRGFQIEHASNGREAIEAARRIRPDLILMDMCLPVMDGWEATRQLKADASLQVVPVIALTSHAVAGERDKALQAGCDDYDTKPVDLPRLLTKIESLLPS